MKKIVIGGSGFLGSKVVETLNGTCQSTYYSNPILPGQLRLDLSNKDNIKDLLVGLKPDVIIHCGGLTKTDFCEVNQDLAARVNFFGTSELLSRFDGKMIYFSTDYVFDGNSAPYDENSSTNPINFYGETKLAAERVVLEKPQNLVVRVSGLYGFNRYNNKFLDRLRNRGVITVSFEQVSTPTYIEDVARALPEFMNTCGVLHFSGEQPFSRYDFIRLAIKNLGLSTEVVGQEEKGVTKRPKNSSLVSIHRLRKTPVEEAFREIRRWI